jgi:hypothetical protein
VSPQVLLILGLVAAVGFVTYCQIDLARTAEVRYLPKWGWAILCLGLGLTIPWGGLLYLAIGKVRAPKPPRQHRWIAAAWPMWRSPGGTAAGG